MKAGLLALAVALAACGDGHHPAMPDAGPGNPDAQVDAPPDAPPAMATLTSYVIDLITNHTADTTAARPYAEFSALPDPDGAANNTSAYSTLF